MAVDAIQDNPCSAGESALAREVDALWQRYPDPTGRTLNILNDLQDAHRYIPEASLVRLAKLSDTPLSHLKQMCACFDYLSLDPVGRVLVTVCDGTACHTQNAPSLLSSLETAFGISVGETTPDGKITLRAVGCVGACGIAPVVTVEGEAHGRMTLSRMTEIVDRARMMADELPSYERRGEPSDDAQDGSDGVNEEQRGQRSGR